MNRKCVVLLIVVFLVSGSLILTAAEPDYSGLDITIGSVRIPKAFIHAGKDYQRGMYWVTLTLKDGFPHFNVHNRNKQLLFEEMAVVKPKEYKGKATKLRHRIRKELLRGYEYFRIKVTRPDGLIMAYLLVNPKGKAIDSNKPKKPAQEISIQ